MGYENGQSVEIHVLPVGFHCYVCELDLDVDELDTFGFHHPLPTRLADVDEFGELIGDA